MSEFTGQKVVDYRDVGRLVTLNNGRPEVGNIEYVEWLEVRLAALEQQLELANRRNGVLMAQLESVREYNARRYQHDHDYLQYEEDGRD